MEFEVGFSRAKSPWKIGSAVIQEVEKRNFSHAYIKFLDPYTQILMVAQASHGMVNVTNYEVFKQDNIIVEEYTINCSETDYKNIVTFIYNNTGKPYSKFQLILIGIKKIFKVEINIRNMDKEYICSEWAARICSIVKIETPLNLDYYTPSDLNTLLKNLGYTAHG